MIRPVLRCLFLFLIAFRVHADALQEAAKALADKIAAHLDAGETGHVVARNISSMPAADAGKLQVALAKELNRRGRRGSRIEVVVTISENLNGYLCVAEVRKRESEAVEMVSFKPDPAPTRPPLLAMGKRLLWQQEEPMLDLVTAGDSMLVLESGRLVRYERTGNSWRESEWAQLNAPPVRDLRGRIEMRAQQISIFFPGVSCHGTWQPLEVACEPVTADFMLGGVSVHFTPGRNTIESGNGMVLLPQNGRGDAIPCGSKTLAAGAGAMDSEDTVTLFDGNTPMSEAAEMPGPVIALWPAPEGALAVVLNLATRQYEAYVLSVDCGR